MIGMKQGVTILVCVFYGRIRLPATLKHIAAQDFSSGIGCELMVVDNASTDESGPYAEQLWSDLGSPFPMRLLHEPKQGLNHARGTGISHARYEYIILCDDDNWLAPGYAEAACKALESNPRIGIVGGYGQFDYETPAPAWLQSFNLYAGGPQAKSNGRISAQFVYGAGAAVRKSAWIALAQAGFRSVLTDRAGHQLTSGGDYELCYAMALGGYEIWYDSSMIFRHHIVSKRLTMDYYLTYIEESADCFPVLEPMKIRLLTHSENKWVFRFQLLKSYCYHVKKFIVLSSKRLLPARNETNKTVATLQYILLKRQLRSYRHLSEMEENFIRICQLHKSLQQLIGRTETNNQPKITVQQGERFERPI